MPSSKRWRDLAAAFAATAFLVVGCSSQPPTNGKQGTMNPNGYTEVMAQPSGSATIADIETGTVDMEPGDAGDANLLNGCSKP